MIIDRECYRIKWKKKSKEVIRDWQNAFTYYVRAVSTRTYSYYVRFYGNRRYGYRERVEFFKSISHEKKITNKDVSFVEIFISAHSI